MQRLTHREVVVPASIGNLGPGFDTVGLAVNLFLRITIRDVIDDGEGRLTCRFLTEPPLGSNRIARAFQFRRTRGSRPSLAVDVASDIPQRAGLGSSAAATLAALRLRELVDGACPPEELLADAAAVEGHPDNVAAAYYGGLTTAVARSDRAVHVDRWPWPRAWRLIVATPRRGLETRRSRRALPKLVPLADARYNFQRVSALLAAAVSGRSGMLREALSDRCHQPYRLRLVPCLREALELQHPDLLGVCLSGSGPSVAAVAARNVSDVAKAIASIYRRAEVPLTIRTLRVHQP